MRILWVSFFGPGFATPGSLRATSAAAALTDQGHSVHLASAKEPRIAGMRPAPGPVWPCSPDRLHLFPWLDLESRLRNLTQCFGVGPARAKGSTSISPKSLARSLLDWPDAYASWFATASVGLMRRFRSEKPDVIVASHGPATNLMLGAHLSKMLGVPWVAEFRDLWAQSHYYPRDDWRRSIDRAWEKHWIKTASHLVTVSEPLAETLRETYPRLPVDVVMNGCAPREQAESPLADDGTFKIVFTGGLYRGRHDPQPLMETLEVMPPGMRVHFFVPNTDGDWLRERFTSERILIHPEASHAKALAAQQDAQILLLLLGRGEATRGVYSTKLFEYLQARRPILLIGPEENNVASILIRGRAAGIHANHPPEIERALTRWWEAFQRGELRELDSSVAHGLSRAEQFSKYESILDDVHSGRTSHR